MHIFQTTFHGEWDRFWAETMFSYIQSISPLLFSHQKGKTSSLKIENPRRHHHNQVITLRFIVKYTDIMHPLIWWTKNSISGLWHLSLWWMTIYGRLYFTSSLLGLSRWAWDLNWHKTDLQEKNIHIYFNCYIPWALIKNDKAKKCWNQQIFILGWTERQLWKKN